MTPVAADTGSFRDPGGRIYSSGDAIYRAIMPMRAGDYEATRDSGLLDRLVERGLLLPSKEAATDVLGAKAAGAAYVLEHPRLPFISYPYEWSFSLLKSAALHHLDTHLAALEAGFTLSDATAYNVQFQGVRPVFIDHLSLRPYQEGEVWVGHRQFCMQFLNPLILWSRRNVPPNHWYRGSLEGLAPEDLAPLLSWRDNLSWTILAHVSAQASMQRRKTKLGLAGKSEAGRTLSKTAFRSTLISLRHFIEHCRPPNQTTVWSDYAGANSYRDHEAEAKRAFVGKFAGEVRPALLLDLGCNSGDYSIAALEAGAKAVIGFDYDFGALELAHDRAVQQDLPFTPLWLDAANPSPSQGWAQAERKGLGERAKADAIIALAFVHHIAIARNVPLEMVVDWLIQMAPTGIIEFPPKSDPMVQRLLASREDIFPDYSEEAFLSSVRDRAHIVAQEHLSEGGRLLIQYDRSDG